MDPGVEKRETVGITHPMKAGSIVHVAERSHRHEACGVDRHPAQLNFALPIRSPWIHTMIRCASAIVLGCALMLPLAAHAQRTFSAKALRGEVAFGTPPEITLNGKPARLAPGARIRDENNMLHLPAMLAGRKFVVNYTTELEGMLLDVWILSRSEMASKPWPTTEQEALAWSFNPSAQTWTKP